MNVYRAFFLCENEAESNLLVDLVLEGRRHIPTKIPFFGSWGRLNSGSIYPFVLQSGRLDFGDEVSNEIASDHSTRYASFDVEDRILAEGELFELSYCGHQYWMRLKRLTPVEQLINQ